MVFPCELCVLILSNFENDRCKSELRSNNHKRLTCLSVFPPSLQCFYVCVRVLCERLQLDSTGRTGERAKCVGVVCQ